MAGCPLRQCRRWLPCNLGQKAPWAGCCIGASWFLHSYLSFAPFPSIQAAAVRRAMRCSSCVVPAAVGGWFEKLAQCPPACTPASGICKTQPFLIIIVYS